MSNISSYIAALVPGLESREIRNNLTSLNDELREFIIPSYRQATEIFIDWKFKNEHIETLNKQMLASFKLKEKKHPKDTSIDVIYNTLSKVTEVLPILVEKIDVTFQRFIEREGLTFNKVTLMQLIESCEFVARYSRYWLTALYAGEMEAYGSRDKKIPKTTPGEWEYLQANLTNFTYLISLFDKPLATIKEGLSKSADMLIDEAQVDEAIAVMGIEAVDPLRLTTLGFPMSVIYTLRSKVVDHQIARYNEAKAEAKVAQFRAMVLEQRIKNGEGDALVERELLKYEDQMLVLKKKTQDMEARYGV